MESLKDIKKDKGIFLKLSKCRELQPLYLNEYKAKLIFYALNKEIANLENSEYLELEINKNELVNLIELRNTIGLLIQGNGSNKNG
tara:strand:- start:392 stop:649 length:258 start_codon:yes stop_codon:yes gene_type:complete